MFVRARLVFLLFGNPSALSSQLHLLSCLLPHPILAVLRPAVGLAPLVAAPCVPACPRFLMFWSLSISTISSLGVMADLGAARSCVFCFRMPSFCALQLARPCQFSTYPNVAVLAEHMVL